MLVLKSVQIPFLLWRKQQQQQSTSINEQTTIGEFKGLQKWIWKWAFNVLVFAAVVFRFRDFENVFVINCSRHLNHQPKTLAFY